MNKQQLINKIIENSVSIITIELQGSEDGKLLKTIYNNNKVINSLMKKNRYSFLREYNDVNIVRDEIYATYYESILQIIEKENYSTDDLEIIAEDINNESHKITKNFIKKLIGYVNNNIKQNLNDPTRKLQTNKQLTYINTKITYYDDYNKLESFMESQDEESLTNDFSKWFDENKHKMLTDTQLSYINNEKIYDKIRSEYSINYKIEDRINNNPKAPQSKEEAKEQNRLNKISTIEEILSIEDKEEFVQAVSKKQSKAYISDAITNYVSPNERKNFNKNTITKQTIKEYRVALFKKLDELSHK